MKTTILQPAPVKSPAASDWLHSVIESICRDFAGRVAREHVVTVAGQIALRFRDARVSTYVPLLVGRFTRERLLKELAANSAK